MTITGAIVLYAVTWFMTLLVVVPIGFRSQDDEGEVTPGTPASAPSGAVMKHKLWQATWIGTLIWMVICGIIMSGFISVDDIDWTKAWREG